MRPLIYFYKNFFIFTVIITVLDVLTYVTFFPGGTEQKVPHAHSPAESRRFHLHQLSLRLPEERAERGPVCHHPHDL